MEPGWRGLHEELVLRDAEVEFAHIVGVLAGQEGGLQMHGIDHCRRLEVSSDAACRSHSGASQSSEDSTYRRQWGCG